MLLENNYHILWLDISANQKQISKRAKDILKYLAIWEIPEFENDFYFTKDYRNGIYVKWALDNLSNPKEKLINTFFWFDIENEEDKRIFKLINDKNFNEAIEIFKNSDNKKNLALLYSLLLLDSNSNNQYKYLIEEAIQIFKDISEDEKFWKLFEKKYFLFDDISTNKELIQDLKNDLWKYLSNLFYDISSKLNDDSVLKTFHQYFKNSKWNKTSEQVEKIYLELNKLSWKLKDMNISDDGVFDDNEKNIVIKINQEILDLLEKLKDLWLYDDSKTLLVRDSVTEAFRNIMLDLNNELDEENEALKILNYALAIVGTDWLKHKINEEYKTITANIKLKPLIQLLDNEDFTWAFNKIEELEKDELNNQDERFLKNLKKRAIFWKLWKWFVEWKELFEKENYIEAIEKFTIVEKLAENNIDLFEWINPEWLNNLLDWIREYLNKISTWELNAKEVFEHIDEIRAKTLKKLSEEDWYFFIFYIDSITYSYLCTNINNNKKKNEPWLWWWLWIWFIIIIFIFVWILFNNDNVSNDIYDNPTKDSSSSDSKFDELFPNGITDEKKSTDNNTCILNWKSYKKPSNSYCTDNDNYNARKCNIGYTEKNNYCRCTFWNYSCPANLDTSYLDNAINSLESKINNMKVNRYNKNSVNQYNNEINKLNNLIEEKNKKLNENCTCG